MLSRFVNYFLAVAEHRSFTRAATALYVSQPALSQQIRRLEESLGTQLFDRTGRVTCLTDAGEVYFRFARRALQDLEEGKRASTTWLISASARCAWRLRLPSQPISSAR